MSTELDRELESFLTAAAEGREWDGPQAPQEPQPVTLQTCPDCGRSDLAHTLSDPMGATLFALAIVAAQETGESFDHFRTSFERDSGLSSNDDDWTKVREAWDCEGECPEHGHE